MTRFNSCKPRLSDRLFFQTRTQWRPAALVPVPMLYSNLPFGDEWVAGLFTLADVLRTASNDSEMARGESNA